MIQEKVFSFQRLGFLLAEYWSQRLKNILYLFVAIAAGLTLWYGINIMLQVRNIFNVHNQIIFYFLGLFLTGCLTGSMLFSDLKVKPHAISYLLLPASALEKLICTLLFGVAGLFIGYSATFILVDTVLVHSANRILHISEPVLNLFSLNAYEPEMGDEKNSVYIATYFAVQAAFILGSVWFKHNNLLKTIIVLVLAWTCFVIMMWCLRNSVPPGVGREDHSAYEVFDPSGNVLITLSPVIHFLDVVFLKFGVTIGLWLAAYFRLKEKQII